MTRARLIQTQLKRRDIMMKETRVALITGSSSGMGRAIALRLGLAGWTVGLVARRRERLEQLAEEIRRGGGQAHVLAGDLRAPDFAARALEELVERAGRLDLLVNNAGAPAGAGEGVATDAQFDDAFALNVRSAYRLSHLALPHLRATKGSIVNVSSAGVARNVPIDLVYLASKGALEALGRGMAKKWAPLGVRVNTVAPGVVPTEIFEVAGYPPETVHVQVAEARKAMQPLPHPGEPQDVAAAVAFLASEEAAFITGATLHVDGGMALGG
ncbi:SDR family oxidoreductase [Archangium violaceum]|nr:SDR family oxidoreductase [Archangium violaceum]